jgi:hypothetical protein
MAFITSNKNAVPKMKVDRSYMIDGTCSIVSKVYVSCVVFGHDVHLL